MILAAEEHILGLKDGKKRYINEVTALSKAFAIAIPHDQAMDATDEVSFFQAVKARLAKFDSTGAGRTDDEIETTKIGKPQDGTPFTNHPIGSRLLITNKQTTYQHLSHK